MREKQYETEDHVRLKPIYGIRPGVWLTALYLTVLIVVLFFLLIFPGLINPRAVLDIKTEPSGAAIRVNGVYMGTCNDRIIVPKGVHTIEAVLPGFESNSSLHEIPGRALGSLFFPVRYKAEITLKTPDPGAAFAEAAADYASWTFAGEPTAIWQIPLSLSEGAYRIGPELYPPAMEILNAAARFTTTRAALRDLVRAKVFLDNGGLSPSPGGLIGSVSDILIFLSENPGSAQWLLGLLPPESAAILRASLWHKNDIPLPPALSFLDGTRRLELAGLSFSSINFSDNGIVKNFMISESLVSKTLYETFLHENPQWRHDDFFELFPAEFFAKPQAVGVSWYAVEAFCQWLTMHLPPPMAGMKVRLPVEAEWEHAANSGIENIGAAGWEWCSDPYAPNTFIKASPEAVQAVGSPERLLLSRPPFTQIDTRASLPPDSLSPFISFRLVIAEK